MTIEMILSGFLFLFILVLNLVMGALGYLMEKDDYDPEADLQKINKNPKKFKISIMIALIEHGSVIALTLMLFIAFSPYSIILGIVWAIFRIGEGLIQFYNEKNYSGLLNIARQYSSSSGAEKNSLSNLARTIFNTKDSRFKLAMICWSIGTLAFSIVLVTSEVVPQIIGWLGIVASILVGFGTGIAKTLADAHEGGAKEAITDAIKRSFRSFGNQFGNSLYGKTQQQSNAPQSYQQPVQLQQPQQQYQQPPSQQMQNNTPLDYSSLYNIGLTIMEQGQNLVVLGDDIFSKKDSIKACGFRWDGASKMWFKPIEQQVA